MSPRWMENLIFNWGKPFVHVHVEWKRGQEIMTSYFVGNSSRSKTKVIKSQFLPLDMTWGYFLFSRSWARLKEQRLVILKIKKNCSKLHVDWHWHVKCLELLWMSSIESAPTDFYLSPVEDSHSVAPKKKKKDNCSAPFSSQHIWPIIGWSRSELDWLVSDTVRTSVT